MENVLLDSNNISLFLLVNPISLGKLICTSIKVTCIGALYSRTEERSLTAAGFTFSPEHKE